MIRWPLVLDEIDREIEADCVPLAPFALETAQTELRRAIRCESSLLRADYLYRARDALIAAGQPRWAEIAEAGARIGGCGESLERLLFDIDAAIGENGDAI